MINLAIDELIEKHWLSVRSSNICKSNGLTQLSALLDYFITHSTFVELPNCGTKSDIELIEMCHIYLSEYTEQAKKNIDAPIDILKTYNSFKPFKKSVFNRFFHSLFKKLSVRAANGLSALSGDYSSVQKYLYLFFSSELDFREIKNIGKKTKDELVEFRGQIYSFLISIIELSPNELNKAYSKLVVSQAIGNTVGNNAIELDSFFTNNDRLHVFRLLKELIVSQQIYNSARTKIFLSLYFQDNLLKMKNVADELGLTRERVRQLTKEIEENFDETFGFIKNFNLSDCVEYGVSTDFDIISINPELTARLNKTDGVNFNPLFYANLIHIFFADGFSLFDPSDADLKRSTVVERSTQNNFYLINKKLFNSFDFEGFLFDINSKLSERITDSYSLYFEGYLIDFFSNKPDLEVISTINLICREILYTELDLVVNQTGYLIFERNVKKQMTDYAIEVLEEIGEIAHISAILEIAAKKFPEVEFNEVSFQSIFTREKDTFISIGRSSTFGLKKWELTNDNLRGGTIKTIVEEYLNGFDAPKHIAEILIHVNQFRNTNEKNVMTNIEIDQSGRFIVFPGEYIGLTSKIYTNTKIYKRLFGTHFRISELKKVKSSKLDDIIAYYTQKYNYLDIQVRSTLMKRVANGEFTLTADNKLIV